MQYKKINRKITKGFTIIEVLIVVAIIGILGAIIMANVNNYTTKAKDAKIKASLALLQLNGFTYFVTHGTYDPPGSDIFCSDSITANIFNSIVSTQKRCNDNPDQWRACAVTNIPSDGSKAWCVDSTGNKKEINGSQCASGSSSPCP